MNNIYINCGGCLDLYHSKSDALKFFEECILMSEGSERERYTKIYFSIKSNLNTNERCFTDGTSYVYDSTIDPDIINLDEEKILIKNFGVNKKELLKFKANNLLFKNSSRIHSDIFNKYGNLAELYEDYLIKNKKDSFYYIDGDSILCIDIQDDTYYDEKFPLIDYEYADKWLKREIEYDEYLKIKNNKQKDYEM